MIMKRMIMKRTVPIALFLLLTAAANAAASDRVVVGNRTIPAPEHLDSLKRAGFDYAELGLERISKMSAEDFSRLREHAKKINLPIPVGAYLLPSDVPITGPKIDKAKQMEVARARLNLAAQLGMKMVIFGSGNVPEGFSREEAFKQLVDFTRRAAPEAAAKGIVLVLVPLQRERSEFAVGSNFINTVGDALSVVEAAKQPNVGMCVDLYHMARNNEDPRAVRAAGKHLRHVMLSNPQGRAMPLDAREYDYASFFTALGEINYQGLVTIFAMGVDGVETQSYANRAPKAIVFVRQIAAQHVKARSAGRRER